MPSSIPHNFSQWKKMEIGWFIIGSLFLLAIGFANNASLLSICHHLFFFCFILLAGKGRPICFLFAGIQMLLLSLLNFQSQHYLQMILNVIYFLPIILIAYRDWKKQCSPSGSVPKTELTNESRLAIFFVLFWGTIMFCHFLKQLKVEHNIIEALLLVLPYTIFSALNKRSVECWMLMMLQTILQLTLEKKSGKELRHLAPLLLFLFTELHFLFKWLCELVLTPLPEETPASSEALPVSSSENSSCQNPKQP